MAGLGCSILCQRTTVLRRYVNLVNHGPLSQLIMVSGRAGVQESPRGGASGTDAQSNSASRKEQWAEESDEDAPDPRMWFEGTSKGAR